MGQKLTNIKNTCQQPIIDACFEHYKEYLRKHTINFFKCQNLNHVLDLFKSLELLFFMQGLFH